MIFFAIVCLLESCCIYHLLVYLKNELRAVYVFPNFGWIFDQAVSADPSACVVIPLWPTFEVGCESTRPTMRS